MLLERAERQQRRRLVHILGLLLVGATLVLTLFILLVVLLVVLFVASHSSRSFLFLLSYVVLM